MSKLQTQEIQVGKLTGELLTRDQIELILSSECGNSVEQFEEHLLTYAQVPILPIEDITNGMYTRRIMIPKGTLLTGRVHKYPYVDIMLSGHIAVATPDGAKELIGANVCDGSPGRKRAGYALEDTDWITVHRVDQLPPEHSEMIEYLTFFSMAEYLVWRDRKDFVAMMIETGHTPDLIRQQSENTADYQPLDELPSFYLDDSPIEGKGMFVNRDFDQPVVLEYARLNGNRTQFGRYVNHSAEPNAVVQWEPNCTSNIIMYSIKPLKKGDEILIDYRQALSLKRE